MKRTAAVLSSLPLLFWIAQGCSSSGDTPGGDTPGDDAGGGGNTDDAGGGGTDKDSGGGGTKKDSGGGDGGVVIQTTPGTSLFSGMGVTIFGVTSDGYVLFGKDLGKTDDAGIPLTDLEVVSSAGGTPTVLAASYDPGDSMTAAVDDAIIVGTTIGLLQKIDATGVGALSVWSVANGGLKPVAAKALDGIYDAAVDGLHVLFAQNLNAANGTADFTVSKPDGTVPTTLYPAVLLKAACPVGFGFGKGIAYATGCTAAAVTATVATLDTGNGTLTAKAGTVAKPGFAEVDANGTHLLYIKSANFVGTTATFDGKAIIAHAQNTAFATLNDDASKVLYRTTLADGGAGELAISPVISNTPTSLVPTAYNVLGVAKDFSNGVVNLKARDVTTNAKIPRYDLNFVSLTAAGAPKLLTAAGSAVGFNTTATHFFFLSDLPTTGGLPIGTLNAHAAAGGTDKVVSKNVIEPQIIDATTKAVWMENVQQDSNGGVYVDLTTADAAGAGAPAVVVQGADPGYYLFGAKMIYTNYTKGLYVVPVP